MPKRPFQSQGPTLPRAAAKPPTSPPKLTIRQRQVSTWLGEDDTYAQIAARLGLKRDTVRGHARAILGKLAVRTRHAAVAQLMLNGLPTTQKGGIDEP